jgi:hypothetical protein
VGQRALPSYLESRDSPLPKGLAALLFIHLQ